MTARGRRAVPLLPLLLAALSACIVPIPAARTTPSEVADPAGLDTHVHELINQHRRSRGLTPLVWDRAIADAARAHSVRMSRAAVAFGHGGFDERARDIAAARPYRAISENVAWNNAPADQTGAMAVRGWLQSRGHRENIEGRFSFTGVGVAVRDGVYHYTQIFVEPR